MANQNQNSGNMSVSEAGRMGGQVSGGNFKNDPERAREAGRKGGQNSQSNQNSNNE